MIIAAYAGAGKSTFAARFPNTVDLPIMPRSWILPPQKPPEEECEKEKGKLGRLGDPLFPENYLIDILRAEREHDFVLIPTNIRIVSLLREKYGRRVVLCYPSDDLKEEYRQRFVARGNSEDFLSLFIEGWEDFQKPIREYQDAVHIVMGSGTYLTDLKERLDRELIADDTKPVPDETIAELEQKLEGRRYDNALCVDWGELWYRIPDILDPEERHFLTDAADRAEMAAIRLMILPIEEPQSLEKEITEDKARVLAYLERLPGCREQLKKGLADDLRHV